MKSHIVAVALAALSFLACDPGRKLSFAEQASAEYLIPIRPGQVADGKFWNKYATKFIYAPAFDFDEADGAESYEISVYYVNAIMDFAAYWCHNPQEPWESIIADIPENAECYKFTASSPKADLSPIWNDIPVGNVIAVAYALAPDGTRSQLCGARRFLRDFPFAGRRCDTIPDYYTAAVRAMEFIHNIPQIQYWKCGLGPDMQYSLNTYPAKIISSTFAIEALLSKCRPDLADDCLDVARNAADYLLSISQPEGSALAGFPPTYHGGLIASANDENQGTTMCMEAAFAAGAYLDLFDCCGDSTYYREAVLIADTYRRIQLEDGSFPVKVNCSDGSPVNDVKAMQHPLVDFTTRLVMQYGLSEYGDMLRRGREWMDRVAIPEFDMHGQFEDVTVLGNDHYQNLTNCTACTYASCILCNPEGYTDSQLMDAKDLIRFSEDQFTHWDFLPNADGIRQYKTPCTVEQYYYRAPVDDSEANMANAYLDLYEATGDELALQKALLLADGIIKAQNSETGCIPTIWEVTEMSIFDNWINCTLVDVQTLLRFSGKDKEFQRWLQYSRRTL